MFMLVLQNDVVGMLVFFLVIAAAWGGIGKLQRLWVLRRDGYRCQGRDFNDKTGKWEQCEERSNLHVHHILAQRWMKTHLPHRDPHRPHNLITLCGPKHHNGENGIHPDMYRALQDYRAGNKDAFEDRMKARQQLTEHGEVYWDTSRDWMLLRIARRLTAKYSRGNPYPEKRRRKDWRPPRR